MANRTKFTDKKRAKFLSELSTIPNVSKAARAIGMSRRGLYDIRDIDEVFAQEWDDAVQEGIDAIEEELHRRAVDGIPEQHYRDGKLVAELTRYSDTLLIFYLKSLRPDKYREKVGVDANVNVTVKGYRSVNPDDWDKPQPQS